MPGAAGGERTVVRLVLRPAPLPPITHPARPRRPVAGTIRAAGATGMARPTRPPLRGRPRIPILAIRRGRATWYTFPCGRKRAKWTGLCPNRRLPIGLHRPRGGGPLDRNPAAFILPEASRDGCRGRPPRPPRSTGSRVTDARRDSGRCPASFTVPRLPQRIPHRHGRRPPQLAFPACGARPPAVVDEVSRDRRPLGPDEANQRGERHRRRDRRLPDRPPRRPESQGPLPVPQRHPAVPPDRPQVAELPVLGVRQERRRVHLRAGLREGHVPRGARGVGPAGRHRHHSRRPAARPPRSPRRGGAVGRTALQGMLARLAPRGTGPVVRRRAANSTGRRSAASASASPRSPATGSSATPRGPCRRRNPARSGAVRRARSRGRAITTASATESCSRSGTCAARRSGSAAGFCRPPPSRLVPRSTTTRPAPRYSTRAN